MSNNNQRIREIREVIQEYAQQNYSRTIQLKAEDDDLLTELQEDIILLQEKLIERNQVFEKQKAFVNNEHDRLTKRVSDLEEKERLFRSLVESAPDASVIVNESGLILKINVQTEELFGYSRDELLNQPLEILMPDRFAMKHHQHRDNYVKNPRFRMMGEGKELLGLHKNGTEFPVEISLSPIKTQDGMLVSAAIRDISKRKKSEETIKKINKELHEKNIVLRNQQAELERANKDLESFSYSVSHDLRAPLRAISGFSQLLLDKQNDNLDETGKRYLDNISKSAFKMGQLIDDILTFSRLGRQRLSRSQFSLKTLFEEVILDLQKQHTDLNIRFSVTELPVVSADYNLLRQVVINLLTNAIKYASKKELIDIKIGQTKKNGYTVYYVSDNGAGFNMKYYDKLFGVFQRLHRESEFEGNGVGLALCKQIIDRHDGEIWAESELNEGSTFYFTLNTAN
jgi:PAS domain S-box-containing protein